MIARIELLRNQEKKLPSTQVVVTFKSGYEYECDIANFNMLRVDERMLYVSLSSDEEEMENNMKILRFWDLDTMPNFHSDLLFAALDPTIRKIALTRQELHTLHRVKKE